MAGQIKNSLLRKSLQNNELQARPKGLEPSTFGSTVRCSIQLSYGPEALQNIKYSRTAAFLSMVFDRISGESGSIEIKALLTS